VRRPGVLLAILAAAACSSLGDPGGPIAIEVFTPSPAVVEVGDTITLRARVLDQAGDSIAATIRWRTPDSTVSVDSLTGRFTGDSAGKSGRVQAISGTLVGPLTQFTVRTRADTVIVAATAESLLVLTTDTASAPLLPTVADSLGAASSGHFLALTIIAPSPAGARLSGDVVADTTTTGSDGHPATPVRVRKAGVVSGDSVIVQIQARRFGGSIIPGSGQKIRVFFQ
jgi:hypothetical protein